MCEGYDVLDEAISDLRAWAKDQPPSVASWALILADNLRLADQQGYVRGFNRALDQQVEQLRLAAYR